MKENQNTVYLWNTQEKRKLFPGMLSSYILAGLTVITFAFAMIAVPISGSNMPSGTGLVYPYLETLGQYPRDYIWQYLAMVMVLAYLVQYLFIRDLAVDSKRVFVRIGSALAILASAVLLINYYIQVNVVVVSLRNGELEGIPLLTQYNPHGIFIALEELGYILMLLSFGCLVPLFWGRGNRLLGLVNLSGLIAGTFGYAIISTIYGLEKLDRYEILVILITWPLLIFNGILIGNRMRTLREDLSSS